MDTLFEQLEEQRKRAMQEGPIYGQNTITPSNIQKSESER
jgi:hypothetical protein